MLIKLLFPILFLFSTGNSHAQQKEGVPLLEPGYAAQFSKVDSLKKSLRIGNFNKGIFLRLFNIVADAKCMYLKCVLNNKSDRTFNIGNTTLGIIVTPVRRAHLPTDDVEPIKMNASPLNTQSLAPGASATLLYSLPRIKLTGGQGLQILLEEVAATDKQRTIWLHVPHYMFSHADLLPR